MAAILRLIDRQVKQRYPSGLLSSNVSSYTLQCFLIYCLPRSHKEKSYANLRRFVLQYTEQCYQSSTETDSISYQTRYDIHLCTVGSIRWDVMTRNGQGYFWLAEQEGYMYLTTRTSSLFLVHNEYTRRQICSMINILCPLSLCRPTTKTQYDFISHPAVVELFVFDDLECRVSWQSGESVVDLQWISSEFRV